MKPSTIHSVIELSAALFILLFVYTATSKLLGMLAFHNTIAQFPLLQRYSLAISWFIPISELIIAVWLFFPLTRILGLYASLGLMTLFTVYIAFAMVYSSHLPCSCGGVISKMTWKQHLLFNLFFIGVAVTGIVLQRKYQLLISRSSRIPVIK